MTDFSHKESLIKTDDFMKTIDLNTKNVPLVAIDKSLDKLKDKIMFPKKLERANQLLSKAKLPPKKYHN